MVARPRRSLSDRRIRSATPGFEGGPPTRYVLAACLRDAGHTACNAHDLLKPARATTVSVYGRLFTSTERSLP